MSAEKQILVVDTERDAAKDVESALPESYQVLWTTSLEEARRIVAREEIAVVLLDHAVQAADDGDAVSKLRDLEEPPEVLVMAEPLDFEAAAESLGRGAFNLVVKPLQASVVAQLVQHAAEKRQLERHKSALEQIVGRQRIENPMICDSPAMQKVVQTVEKVAAAAAPVLITGETGSGKGLVAQYLHNRSPRAKASFLNINCGALQEQLLESELFGHEKGAFTGATAAKMGLFEVADGGTLFLDEISELTPGMQAKLLQVLDSGELRRVGGTKMRAVDTRVVAATNRRLKTEVQEERFRQDLFFRLNVVRIQVPPLRDRQEDIPGLVDLYLERYRPPGSPPKAIARRAVRLLMEYHWPGNVRELANTIQRASLMGAGDKILPEDLPAQLQPHLDLESQRVEVPLPMKEIERLHILRTLEYTGGKKAPAARILGIDIKTLSKKVKDYGIEV